MEEEDLDWGDTEITQGGNGGPADDADDGVSLGSDSGDEADNAVAGTTATARSSPDATPSAPIPEVYTTSRSGSPYQNHSLQRQSSSNSLNSVKRNDHSSTASPKPRNRRSKSSSVSGPKVIHGLPPKPVVTSVPFLPPSHPSLTEATRISDGGKNKPGSSANKSASTKPVSSDTEGPLPPDWQIRHPRSGDRNAIYYYNTRTHQSTWTRPDSHTSSHPEATESDHSREPLSYEDRHYRPTGGGPSDTDAPSSHATRRGGPDSRFGNVNEDRRDASSSPTRTRNRSSSPVHRREHASGRRNRPLQHNNGRGQRHTNSDRDRDRDSISLVQESDRHWVPSTEDNAPSTASGLHKSRRSQHNAQQPQDYPDEPHSSYDTYSEREKPDSSYSRRSPSPRARELRRQEERQDNLPPPTHSGKRDRPSRFAPPVASGSVASDPWVPDEFAEPTTSAPPTSHHEHANRDRSRGRDLPEGHQDIVRAQPSSVSRNMYDDTAVTSSSHPSVHVSEPSQPPASHRKRAPLPPQSMHFREVSKSSGRGRADVVPSEATAAAYHGPSPIATSNANAHPSPVSAHGSDLPPPRGHGDRDRGLVRDLPPHQMQMLPQNQSQNQHPRASKFGPPVPSSSSQKVEHDVPPHYDQQVRDGRRDRDRDRDRERDTRDEGRERGRGRDRDRGERRDKRRDRDVSAADEPSSPATSSSLRHPPPSQSQTRLPSAPLHGNAVATSNRNRSRSVSADPSIRAGSGMYADRELVPVGISMPVQDVPLSMPVPTPTQTSASAPKGPRAHGHGPTSPSTNMYPPRRGRSPSHMSMVPHRDDRYDQPPPQMRDGPRSWKEEMMVERGGHRGRGRGRGMGRGGPPLPLSGTNNIPVGARHGHGHGPGPAPNNYNEMPPPPSGLSSVNMMPVKNVRSRFSSGHEPTEAGEPSGHSYSGPKGVYPPEQEVSEHGRHAPSVYEREEDDRRGGRPRRQSFTHEDTRQRSFYPDDEPHPQRRWGAPQDDRYNSTEDPRSPTPPPASREPSYNDNWEPNADYGHGRRRHKNPPAHRHDEADLVENTHAFEPPSPSNGHENGHRPHGLPMKPTTRPPSDIPDDRRRHRRSSIAGSDGHWEHSPVEHRRRPDSPHHHSSIDIADRPVLEEPLSSMRSSKPVKIRRPPPEPSYSNYDRDRERDLPPHNGSTMADDDVVMDDVGPSANPGSGNGRRPSNTRRGGSLLDRLSGVGNDTPSLKDRVNVPSKRDRDQMSVDDGRYPREVGDQVSVGTGEEGSSKRAKKRHAKPKRGRGRGGGGGGGGGAVYT